jgi:uncharacterized protein YndB with AHSA1/START domain
MAQPSARVPEAALTVEGTADEVWELISTGPGISTWFLPAIVEQQPGGTILQRYGPEEDDVSRSTIRIYDAPRRLLYEENTGDGTVGTEVLLEPQSPGSCRVRILTHGLPADDAVLTPVLLDAWSQAFATLRVYLASFRGRPAASLRVWAERDGDVDAAWREVRRGLGLTDAAVGDPVRLGDDTATAVTGTVELLQPQGLLARLDRPHPGVLRLSATGSDGSTSLILDRFVYADDAAAAAQEERPWWERRLNGHRHGDVSAPPPTSSGPTL